MITAADNFAAQCVAAGCAKDQIKNFIRFGYVPSLFQLKVHAACRDADNKGAADQVGVGGARGPGKSHAIFAQLSLDDCQRVPNLKALYLRKVGKTAREQLEDLRRSVLFSCQHDYNKSTGVIEFHNKSRIVMGHFRTESDIDNYLGIEYDVIAIEETTTLTESKYKALRDSNRTAKGNWRPRVYNTTNPGGVGHAWYKRRFSPRNPVNAMPYTAFIFGTVDDNPYIDDGYTRKLDENVGWKKRAYRFGDWEISAGQFFTNWKRDVHVGEFETYGMDRYWMAKDYGFNHWDVTYLAGESDGIVYVIDELAVRKTLSPTIAVRIKSMLSRHALYLYDISAFPAGHDVFAQRGTGETIAEQYQKYDIILDRAKLDRINGAGAILTRFGDEENGIAPTVKIHPRCVRLIENIPAMQHDPNRPEDVLKVNANEEGQGGDDFYDAFRYLIMEAGQGTGGWGANPMEDYRG